MKTKKLQGVDVIGLAVKKYATNAVKRWRQKRLRAYRAQFPEMAIK